MVVVTNNWKMWSIGMLVSLGIFLVIYFTVIQSSENTANQAIKTGLQQSQQALNQAQKQLSTAGQAASSSGGAASSAGSAASAAGSALVSKAAKLTACTASAGTNATALQACATKYGG